MKSTFAFAVLAIAAIGIASCSTESTYHDMSNLPQTVQTVITENFDSDVISANVEANTIGIDEYEVFLANGTKVKFEGEEWEEVSVPATDSIAIPDYFVSEPIRTYVTTNMPGQNIVKIERDKNGYDIKLANNVELEFSADGTFLKVD